MYLIIVEGKTDKIFIEAYIEFLKSKRELQENFEPKISSVDSKDNLKNINDIKKYQRNLKIIFDADSNIEQAKENIQKQLKEIAQENVS